MNDVSSDRTTESQPPKVWIGSHYVGKAGDQYVEVQRTVYQLSSKLNRWKFAEHVSLTSTVVDFGCADGGLLAELNVGYRIGVEATKAGIALADQRLDLVVQSLDELPDETTDVVISNHALEHTLNPASELAHMLRVLRRGGKLVLWLPLDDWRSQRSPQTNDPDQHLYAWTPLLLGNLLTEVGFELERCRVVHQTFPPKLPVAIRLLGRSRVESLSRLRIFDLASRIWARVSRRRQLMAIARRPL